MSQRLVVLVSGSGTNLQALIDTGDLDLVAVFCNRTGVQAIERARQAGIPCHVRTLQEAGKDRAAYDTGLADAVAAAYRPDLIVLAGWMQIFTRNFLDRFPSQVLNLHPAPLPDNPADDRVLLPDNTWSPVFRGKQALEDALAAGVRYVGSTVHWVTLDVDRGQVIAREAIPVQAGESFESVRARLLQVEHRLLPAAVREVLVQQRV